MQEKQILQKNIERERERERERNIFVGKNYAMNRSIFVGKNYAMNRRENDKFIVR